MIEKKVFTVREAAEWLGMTPGSLRVATCRHRIPYYKAKHGLRNYFKLEDLEAYALATRVPSAEEVRSKAEMRSLNNSHKSQQHETRNNNESDEPYTTAKV